VIERCEWYENKKQEFERDPEYWAEAMKLDFAEGVGRLMEERKMTRADLARRLGTSPAYVTKILRWTANLTLESMAKIALALDARVALGLVPKGAPLWPPRSPHRRPDARRTSRRHEFVASDKPARANRKR
jgi:transcriptional regulator with XRE-family HTH domain